MKKIASILAILLLLTTVSLAEADKVIINYPSNLRVLRVEVGEGYSFEVSIKNDSDESIEVAVEVENESLMNLLSQESLILGPNQGINLPVTFSVNEVGEFSEFLRITLIDVGEDTTRKGNVFRIRLEGLVSAKEKEEPPWVLVLILSGLGALGGIILYILRKIFKR